MSPTVCRTILGNLNGILSDNSPRARRCTARKQNDTCFADSAFLKTALFQGARRGWVVGASEHYGKFNDRTALGYMACLRRSIDSLLVMFVDSHRRALRELSSFQMEVMSRYLWRTPMISCENPSKPCRQFPV